MSPLYRIIPTTALDRVAFVITLVLIHGIFAYEAWFVLPYISRNRPVLYYSQLVMATFVYVNIAGNLWKVVVTDTSSGGAVLPAVLKPRWFFCRDCESNAPPRSFHCHVCRRCVLARDHHCPSFGKCVGHANLRFYLFLLFYLCIASLCFTIVNVRFTLDTFGGFSFRYLLSITVPLLAWLLGMLESSNFLAGFVSALCSIIFFFITMLLVYHVQNLLRGQTVYERRQKVTKYNLGWKRNIVDAFGKNFDRAWIFPFIPSPLPGNGIDFPTRESYESTKTI